MKVITFRDYADQRGISYEAVRQQVVRYRADLEGHIVRDGRQQLLDEEAVSFLESKRKKNPVTIIQQSKDEELQLLRQQKEALMAKVAEQGDKLDALHTRLEEMLQLQLDAKAATLALAAKNAAREGELRKEAENAREAAENAEKRASEAVAAAEEAKAEVAAAVADLQAEQTRKLTLRERLLGRKK